MGVEPLCPELGEVCIRLFDRTSGVPVGLVQSYLVQMSGLLGMFGLYSSGSFGTDRWYLLELFGLDPV